MGCFCYCSYLHLRHDPSLSLYYPSRARTQETQHVSGRGPMSIRKTHTSSPPRLVIETTYPDWKSSQHHGAIPENTIVCFGMVRFVIMRQHLLLIAPAHRLPCDRYIQDYSPSCIYRCTRRFHTRVPSVPCSDRSDFWETGWTYCRDFIAVGGRYRIYMSADSTKRRHCCRTRSKVHERIGWLFEHHNIRAQKSL